MLEKIYVVFEGPVGVGKTTLARIFQPILDAELVMELGKDNPFLSVFLNFRDQYALPMQLYFLLDRYKQHALEIPKILENKSVISDCMFARDWIFAHLGLNDVQIKLYEPIYRELSKAACNPNLIVYLRADEEILSDRLRNRGDDTTKWTTGFLRELVQIYDDYFKSYKKSPFITVDTNQIDFTREPDKVQFLYTRIQTALSGGVITKPNS